MDAYDTYEAPPVRRPAEMRDAELLDLLQREGSDARSREAVLSELASRGLLPPAAGTSPDYAFATDRFDENPYQTPQAAAPPDFTASLWSRAKGPLWWVHVGLFSLLALRMVYVAIFFRPDSRVTNTFFALFTFLSCVGLAGWRLRKPLLFRGVWILLAMVAWGFLALMSIGCLGMAVLEPAGSKDRVLALQMLGVLPLFALQCRGLHHYAFRSQSIWQ